LRQPQASIGYGESYSPSLSLKITPSKSQKNIDNEKQLKNDLILENMILLLVAITYAS
jgi:hypothetical protein